MYNSDKQKIIEILTEFEDKLPKEKKKFVLSLLDQEELGVAIESICDWLYDFDIKPINSITYDKIKTLGEELHVDMNRILPLTHNIG